MKIWGKLYAREGGDLRASVCVDLQIMNFPTDSEK
jgi:hypothetical protein